MSRWHSLSIEGKQRRVDSNKRWRKRNQDKTRAWGLKSSHDNAEQRREYARKRHRILRTDPSYLKRMAKRNIAAYVADPVKYFYKRIFYVYGLTREQYDTMLQNQRGVCAVCLLPESHIFHGKVKRLSIDHCHKTGKVRGLLCHHCNAGLGHFRENPGTLRRMAAWIESQQ